MAIMLMKPGNMPRISETFISFLRAWKRRREYTYATMSVSTVVIMQLSSSPRISVFRNQRGKLNSAVSVNRRT